MINREEIITTTKTGMDKAKSKIDEFIRKYDPITTLFLVCKKYTYGNAREKAVVMDEHPVVPFLYNLYVSCGEYGQQMPSENDIEQLIKDTEDYCKNFFVSKNLVKQTKQ